jgi:hypothetical protein
VAVVQTQYFQPLPLLAVVTVAVLLHQLLTLVAQVVVVVLLAAYLEALVLEPLVKAIMALTDSRSMVVVVVVKTLLAQVRTAAMV